MQKLLRLVATGSILLVPLASASNVLAASASMSLSPGSGNETQNNTFSVDIYENSGTEPVNAVTATLTYPTSLLSYEGAGSSSAFSIVVSDSGSNGSVNIGRGALPAVTGNQLVASLRFKALAGGTASVMFTSDSKVVSAKNNTDILAGTSGGNYEITASSSNTSPNANQLTISGVSVHDVGTDSATVAWTTSQPATSEVNYGFNNSYGLTAADSSFGTSHKLKLNSALLVPGTKYHFVAKSVDNSGNVATTKDQTFTTKGATLLITVIDQNKKPISRAHVAVGNISGDTDKNGQVTLTGFQLGKTVVVVTYRGQKRAIDIEVAPIKANSAPQAITVAIQRPDDHSLIIFLSLLLVAVLVALAVANKRRPTKKS